MKQKKLNFIIFPFFIGLFFLLISHIAFAQECIWNPNFGCINVPGGYTVYTPDTSLCQGSPPNNISSCCCQPSLPPQPGFKWTTGISCNILGGEWYQYYGDLTKCGTKPQGGTYCCKSNPNLLNFGGCCLRSCEQGSINCTDGCFSGGCPASIPGVVLYVFTKSATCQDNQCVYIAASTSTSDTNVVESKPVESKPVEFVPQVTIPGSIDVGEKTFTVNQGQGITVDGSLLSKYIAILFNWLIGAIGIVTVAYLAFGGLQWLGAAGNASGINKAKETIRDALIGMLLVAGSYTMLYVINPNLVGFRNLNITKIDPLMLKFDEGDVFVGQNGVDRNASGYSSVQGLVCYKQAWNPWGSKLYGDCEIKDPKVPPSYKNAACGPTSVAMVVSTLKNQTIDPIQIGNQMVSGGYRVCNSGTSDEGILQIPKKYGLTTNSVNWDGATQCLSSGGFVVVKMWGSLKQKPALCDRFTYNGHYMVIGGINGNKVLINDPAGSSPRSKVNYSGTEGGVNGCYREDSVDDVKTCAVTYTCIKK